MGYLQNLQPQNSGLLGNADDLALQLRQQGSQMVQPARNVRGEMEQMAAQTNQQAQQEQAKKDAQQQALGKLALNIGIMAATGGFGGGGEAVSGAGEAIADEMGKTALESAGFGETLGKELAMKAGDVGHGLINKDGGIVLGNKFNPVQNDWRNVGGGLMPSFNFLKR